MIAAAAAGESFNPLTSSCEAGTFTVPCNTGERITTQQLLGKHGTYNMNGTYYDLHDAACDMRPVELLTCAHAIFVAGCIIQAIAPWTHSSLPELPAASVAAVHSKC